MNYLKLALYSLFFTVFFYPLMEIASSGGRLFDSSFFTLAGFLAIFLYALSNVFMAAYSVDYGRKKDAEEKANSK